MTLYTPKMLDYYNVQCPTYNMARTYDLCPPVDQELQEKDSLSSIMSPAVLLVFLIFDALELIMRYFLIGKSIHRLHVPSSIHTHLAREH